MTLREMMPQKGFTMPELLVVSGVLTLLVVGAVALIHPADYSPQARDAERLTETAQLAQAFRKYATEHGAIPDGIKTEPMVLGTEDGMLDLCQHFVPKYLKDIPLDPVGGASVKDPVCEQEERAYSSGYLIKKGKNNELVISAPIAEGAKAISITLQY